jgi:hypothetical protein
MYGTNAEYMIILDWLRHRWDGVASFTLFPPFMMFIILFEDNATLPDQDELPLAICRIGVVYRNYERYAPLTDPPFPFRGDGPIETARPSHMRNRRERGGEPDEKEIPRIRGG